jgi:hypothetical protein
MIVDIKIIQEYIALQEKLEKLFEEAKLEKKRYYEAINLTRPTFARKLKEKSFTPDELLNLANEINKTFTIK